MFRVFELGQGQAAVQDAPTRSPSFAGQKFTAGHRACTHLPVLHLLIRYDLYELQHVVAHA